MSEKTAEQRLAGLLFYGFVGLLIYLVFRLFMPFLAPLIWAAVLVVLSYRWYERVAARVGPTFGALISTITVTVLLILPVVLVTVAFIHQGVQLAHSVQKAFSDGHMAWANRAWASMEDWFADQSGGDLSTLVQGYAEKAAAFFASKLGVVLGHVVGFFFGLVVMMIAMYYLFKEGETALERLRQALPFEAEHRDRMISETHELIIASVMSSLATAVLHGVVGGLMFLILGIHSPVVWAVLMGFLSLLPVVGSSIIWLPAAIWLMIQGHIPQGIILIAVCSAVVAIIENILRPWMISGRAQISGLLIFISILGGISVFGPLGIILGPVIVAAAESVLDITHDTETKKRGHRPKPVHV